MSLEMAHKVILPPKKNYIKKFLKQRDIGIFIYQSAVVHPPTIVRYTWVHAVGGGGGG